MGNDDKVQAYRPMQSLLTKIGVVLLTAAFALVVLVVDTFIDLPLVEQGQDPAEFGSLATAAFMAVIGLGLISK